MNTCTTCGGPRRLLFTGFYCVNACDQKPSTDSYYQKQQIVHDNKSYWIQTLRPGDPRPDWAVFGMYVEGGIVECWKAARELGDSMYIILCDSDFVNGKWDDVDGDSVIVLGRCP